MTKATPYIRLINLIRETNSASPGALNYPHVELLAFVAEQCQAGYQLKITDLIYLKDFGTGQTISNKVAFLSEHGYLKQESSSTDARIKIIKTTEKTEKYFREKSKLLCELCSH